MNEALATRICMSCILLYTKYLYTFGILATESIFLAVSSSRMVRSLVKLENYLSEGNDTDNNALIERKLFPNSSIHFLVVEVVTKDWSNDTQNERYSTQRDMCLR